MTFFALPVRIFSRLAFSIAAQPSRRHVSADSARLTGKSGKTFCAVEQAVKRLSKTRRLKKREKIFIENLRLFRVNLPSAVKTALIIQVERKLAPCSIM